MYHSPDVFQRGAVSRQWRGDAPTIKEAPGGVSRGEKDLCAGIRLAEGSLDSNNPQDCGKGQIEEAKNLEQTRQSEYLTVYNNTQEQEERAKETHNLVKECPEFRDRKGIVQEKTRIATGEDMDTDWTFETGKVENDGRNTDWSKKGGNKCYSLMEDSEAASSGYDLNEEDGSGSSEAESLSPTVGPVVRPQRRHRKCITSRTGSAGIADSPEGCAVTLKWDYSGIRLSQSERDSKAPRDTVLTPNLTAGGNCPDERTDNMAGKDTNMLQLIYGMVRELQMETRAESRRAQVAAKQLQVTVRKIAKPCSEMEEKLNTVESRTSVVEGELVALREHVDTHGGQLTDVMWKMEDFENRQR
ncbi:hypothetical protein NDU88_003798 [Pleurodeles waltl]|uniref:Uncharacterized protein n=1 Tax=Pleurodeles waltl TaxID=8319 RepID=A0AAV7LI32_PLEWA|nr:hypothetical protein NDU88_003798 [Pleurodeles waltl]